MTDAPGRSLRWSRAAVCAASLAVLAVATSQAAGGDAATPAPPLTADAEGRRLVAGDAGPVVQPVRVPAEPQLIAAVPGRNEAWAVGVSMAPSTTPGADVEDYNSARQLGAQEVFLHYDPQHGWQSAGPPMENGQAHNPSQVTVLSIATNGDGWAAGAEPNNPSGNTQVMYHKPVNSDAWQVVETPVGGSNALSTSVNALSVNSDASGTYGVAVLNSGSVLVLQGNGTWQNDSTGVDSSVYRVVAVSRTAAWAAGGAAAQQFQQVCVNSPNPQACLPSLETFLINAASGKQTPDVFYRSATGWSGVKVPTPQHGGSALSLAASGNTAWIGGATNATPWVERIDFGGAGPSGPGTSGTSYCASGCDRGFPESTGALYDMQLAGGDLFAAGGAGGLFHFSRGGWTQEPTTVGPVGGSAFMTPDEGWLIRLDSYYGIGAAYSPPVLGHYTRNPDAPLLRTWPDIHTPRLTSIATDPSGSGVAMAGGDGTILRLDPGSGIWSAMALPAGVSGPVSAISWPRSNQAWAVAGSRILRFDGSQWQVAPVNGNLGGATLNAISVGTTTVAPQGPPPQTPPAQHGANPSAPPLLVAWGDNQYGELGDGTDAGRPLPDPVQGLDGVVVGLGNSSQETIGSQTYNYFSVALVCSKPTSCAHDGRAFQWGRLLGKANVTRARAVTGLAGHPITAVAAGGDHVLALDAGGTVWAWGDDGYDQLGDAGAAGSTAVPQKVSIPGTVVSISAGARHSLATDSHGVVWCWGDNGSSQCGQSTANATIATPTPVAGVAQAVQVAAGADFSLARTTAGAVWAWGTDTYDQLGTANAVANLTGTFGATVPQAIPGLTASAIGAGEEFGAAISSADGSVVTWGLNVSGQLGTGSHDNQDLPAHVPGLTGVTQIAVAGAHAVALTGGGQVYGWGQNVDGEVGDVGQRIVASPFNVAGLDGARSVGAGRQSSFAVIPAPPPGQGLHTTGPPPPAQLVGPFLGYAVGSGGITVRFDGRSWTVDPQSAELTDQNLHAVAMTTRDAVAAGNNGALLVNDGNGWRRGDLPQPAVDFAVVDGYSRHLVPPNLTVATALADGTVLLGGERGTLLERAPGDYFTTFRVAPMPPFEGWVHGLAARRDSGGGLHVAVVVGHDPNVDADINGRPDDTTTLSGAVLVGDGGSWRDAEYGDAVQDGTGTEQTSLAPRLDDVQALGMDARGMLGWAVGGTGSTWRLALQGTPPASPMTRAAAIDTGPGLSFAFLADTGCLQGICRHQLGWSPRGDVVMGDAMQAINRLGRQGRLAFAGLGGDLREPGGAQAADLVALRPLFDSLTVPVFAALGSRDLLASSAANWESAFGDRPAPWGGGGVPAGIAPLGWLPGAVHHPGAATHYAFDVVNRGRARLRVVVLDTSSLPLAANDSRQNPTESQAAWLLSTLLGARNLGVPAVIVMNRLAVATPSAGAGDVGVDAALRTAGAAGVIAVGMPANQLLSANGTVPVGVFGGGGGRFLSAGQTGGDAVPGVDQRHGYYFSWQLVTLAPGADAVTIRSIPVLRDLAVDAPRGQVVAAGSAISFTGLGRTPRSAIFQSYGSSDSEFDPQTLGFPFPRHCGASTPGGGPGCSPGNVAIPDYRFSSDDGGALTPVVEDPAHLGHPLHDGKGQAIADPTGTSGLFCATRAGSHTVTLTAGTVAARIAVDVGNGARSTGECARIATPRVVSAVLPVTASPPQPKLPPAPVQPPAPAPILPHQEVPQQPPVAALAPPPINPIPAPPGGTGAGERQREEEHEAATEDNAMTALDHGNDPSGPLGLTGAALGATLLGAALGVGSRRRRSARPAAAWVGRPPTLRPHQRRGGWRR